MVNTRSVRAKSQAQPPTQGQAQYLNNLPPHIPNLFPPVEHVERGDENQPHNLAPIPNQGNVVSAQLSSPQCNNSLAQNASDALMCKIFLSTLRGNARMWYYSLPPRSISSYTKMTSAFATKFFSRRLIRKTTSELMRVMQRDRESLKNYMSRFNDAVLEVSSFDQAMGIAVLIQGLNHERFRDNLIKHRTATCNKGPQPQGSRNVGNRQGVGYQQAPSPLPPPARIIHMITGGLEAGGLSSKQRKLYVREVKHQNRAQKRKFDNADWKNQPITFISVDFDTVVTPHNDPLVTSVMINNCEVQRVLVDTRSAPNIMYYHCFESLGLDLALLQRGSNITRQPEVARHCYITSVTRPQKGQDQTSETISQEVHDNQQVMGVEVDYCEWVANPLLVKKANGKWRICIDYTNLNKTSPKDCYPVPNIDKLVEAAFGNERLSLLDAYSGYHQVLMALEDEEKTSFYVDDEIYCFVMMPFGLKNAAEDHLADLDETFNNLRKNKMQSNPAKCIFGVEFGKFLGFMVSRKGIEVNPEKIKAVAEMEPPRSIKNKSECLGRLIKWAVELGESKITFQQRSAIRAQALVDFIMECTSDHSNSNPEPDSWILYVDGASSSKGSRTCAFLVGSDGYRSEHALKFHVDATNNMAEYEALLLGLQLVLELKVTTIQVYSDLQLVVNQVNSVCKVVDSIMMKYVALVAELR
ncbi:hypothetical protein SLEP1_g45796 [Rubroshorea leprosula]|uniref:RNase H type-1 domain-containing protein n=1 Tax=Rubroshorea leprosula TaxID=152421 RepID=A0AAV5LK67_9ROSI|nr:hypothetical protein SLEP1_g45796 [Rubroshorea leprosula]